MMLTPEQIPNNDNNLTLSLPYNSADQEGFLTSSEDQIEGLYNEIRQIKDKSDPKRKYMIGLKAFYEFAVGVAESVAFADQNSFIRFTEMWFKAIENYSNNREELTWKGLPIKTDSELSLTPENAEKVMIYLRRYVEHDREYTDPAHTITYAEKAELGLYELLIKGLENLKFRDQDMFEEFADTLPETLTNLAYDEEFIG